MTASKQQRKDGNRLTWFLMGAVLALAVLFTALEYNAPFGDEDIDESLLEDFSGNIEPYPIVEKTPILTAAAKQEDKVSIDKLKITETTSRDSIASPKEGKEDGKDDVEASGTGDDDLMESQDTQEEDDATMPQPLDFRVVQQIPEFPGGMGAFIQWLTKNLRYPALAQKRQVEGKVVVTFIVNEDGTTTDLKVAKSADALLEKEAMRVMTIMPKWKPGVENDKPCRTMMAVPIYFKL